MKKLMIMLNLLACCLGGMESRNEVANIDEDVVREVSFLDKLLFGPLEQEGEKLAFYHYRPNKYKKFFLAWEDGNEIVKHYEKEGKRKIKLLDSEKKRLICIKDDATKNERIMCLKRLQQLRIAWFFGNDLSYYKGHRISSLGNIVEKRGELRTALLNKDFKTIQHLHEELSLWPSGSNSSMVCQFVPLWIAISHQTEICQDMKKEETSKACIEKLEIADIGTCCSLL